MYKNNKLYFDHESATYLSDATLKALIEGHKQFFGNPLSATSPGQKVVKKLKGSYEVIGQVLGLTEEQSLLFTSSGAESINQVLWSTYMQDTREEGKNHYLTSKVEEAPPVIGLERLAREFSCSVGQVPVDHNGQITEKNLTEHITPRTALLSISLVNALTGVIQPLDKLRPILRERGILLHVDVTHALGKIPLELAPIGADFITFDGQGMHGPQGIGGLVSYTPHTLLPFIVGGAEQAGKRAGAWNAPMIYALEVAARETMDSIEYMNTEIALLRDRFEDRLLNADLGVQVHFTDSDRVPNIAVCTFEGIANDLLLYRLNKRGVAASFGGGNFQQIALIMEACGIPKPLSKTALSFSLCKWHTKEDIDALVHIIKEEVEEVKALSQYWREAWS
jgi:cysteine desulfurase